MVKLRDIDADQLAGVFVMFFLVISGRLFFFLTDVFESAKFPNAEAFWCGLSNHVRSDLLYLGAIRISNIFNQQLGLKSKL